MAGAPEDYRTRHPGPAEIALLVEVAETSLGRDQGDKLQAYAAGGIAVYWIVNLIDRRVEMYTEPSSSGYQRRQFFVSGQDVPVTIAGIERGRIAVAEIFA